MHVISLVNQKGGVGKSTLAVMLYRFLSDYTKKQILLIDADGEQGSSYQWGRQRGHQVLPVSEKNDFVEITKKFDNLRSIFDFVIVDGPCGTRDISGEIINASDFICVPIGASHFDIKAKLILNTLIAYKEQNILNSKYAVIINKRTHTKKYRNVRKSLFETYGSLPILDQEISQLETFDSCLRTGDTPFDAKDIMSVKAQTEIKNVGIEILNLLGANYGKQN